MCEHLATISFVISECYGYSCGGRISYTTKCQVEDVAGLLQLYGLPNLKKLLHSLLKLKKKTTGTFLSQIHHIYFRSFFSHFKFFATKDFKYVQMDTDSSYMALVGPSKSLVKSDKRVDFYQKYEQLFIFVQSTSMNF